MIDSCPMTEERYRILNGIHGRKIARMAFEAVYSDKLKEKAEKEIKLPSYLFEIE